MAGVYRTRDDCDPFMGFQVEFIPEFLQRGIAFLPIRLSPLLLCWLSIGLDGG